jgi:hypothetical protein
MVCARHQWSIQLARDFLHQWRSARHHDSNTTTQPNNNNMRWQPQVTGTVKSATSTQLYSTTNINLELVCCIWNDQGRFMKAKTMWFYGNPPPMEAEACALKEGI